MPLRPPDRERMLAGPVERCGHCMLLWPADEMRDELREDGLFRVCPNGSSPSTDIDYTTRVRERVAEDAERYIAMPLVSLAPTEQRIPPTVTMIEDADGASVFNGQPLRVVRGSIGVLVLRGRSFPDNALPIIAFLPGVVLDVSTLTDAEGMTITLQFTVSPLCPRGKYDITFYNGTLHGVLLVR